MKKSGFTLAEVLVTLGIIGVIAALTTPALINSTSDAKIGPQLSKAVSTFETAAEMLLHDENVSGLFPIYSSVHQDQRAEVFARKLGKFMKIEYAGTDFSSQYHSFDKSRTYVPHQFDGATYYVAKLRADKGPVYYLALHGGRWTPHSKYPDVPNNEYLGEMYIDINGDDAPNTIAKDLFRFVLYNDGTLRPYGSKSNYDRRQGASPNWTTHYCNDTHGVYAPGWTCTGSIFDNNMKLIYNK